MTRQTRKNFTVQQIVTALEQNQGHIPKAAKDLSALGKGTVSRQLLNHWVHTLDEHDTAPDIDETGDDVSFDHAHAKLVLKATNLANSNSLLRKENKALAAEVLLEDGLLREIAERIGCLKLEPTEPIKQNLGGKRITAELLLSDWQIGKLTPDYSTPIALRRLQTLSRATLFQIRQKITAGYNVERCVIAMIGDIIESDKKHSNSGRATDIGTAEQTATAITALFEYLIVPIGQLGIPVDVVCVTGNHDHDDHGMMQYQAGKEHLSYILYKSLELLAKTVKLDNIKFIIPRGSFTVIDFYGQKALYEHGVGVSVTETSMRMHKAKRTDQLKQYITYFRMGDKHTVTTFNSGQYVVNGAFFGTDSEGAEYSSMAGYSSVAAQWLGFHVARPDNGLLSLYDSFTIQLGHVK